MTPGGKFAIGPADGEAGVQSYVENTNILRTVFETSSGRFQVIDFAPRFVEHGQTFMPTQIFRVIEPLEGCWKFVVSAVYF